MSIEQIHDSYHRQVERIQSNRAYSEHAKQVLYAKAWTQAAAKLEQLRQSEITQVATRREQLNRKMFGHDGTADPNTAILRRDANDRASKLDTPRAAAEALEVADRDGDRTLAQAVAARACDYGWTEVIDQYVALNPAFGEAAKEWNSLPGTGDPLWEARHAANFYLSKPAPIEGMRDGQVQAMAAEDMEAA
ncbi:hypothetical protein [Streptomyces sp. NPDC051704]|uniref:hypothetical protein n=1 Tax=Streptomyces sp. NPDC051704 TaxID=3365671 RepID=UPI0037AC86DA